ncbi:hypothetical protein ACWN56_05330 [Weissella viridescens]|uniref:Uncharacterized protein n=1 Tax=Weissella viridescens TaxID=1629 RepID=A0A380P836_WEIVI|nr:hypothetical protein [Weissella viridescens]MBX4172591.1 hypothetical protein [Weissella viridescens]SUP61373.1 Uncharacterised protein [Weissella viridescens]
MAGTVVSVVIFIVLAIGSYQVVMHIAEPVVNFCLGLGRMVVYPIVWACNGREAAESIRNRKGHKRWVIDSKN